MRDRIERIRDAVDGVGVLLKQAAHRAKAFVVGLLQTRELVLDRLNLRLQRNHILIRAEGRRREKKRQAECACAKAVKYLVHICPNHLRSYAELTSRGRHGYAVPSAQL